MTEFQVQTIAPGERMCYALKCTYGITVRTFTLTGVCARMQEGLQLQVQHDIVNLDMAMRTFGTR